MHHATWDSYLYYYFLPIGFVTYFEIGWVLDFLINHLAKKVALAIEIIGLEVRDVSSGSSECIS